MGNAQTTEYQDCSGKVAIITGANTGLGKRSSLELLKCKYKIILAVRSVDRGTQAVADIKEDLLKDRGPFLREDENVEELLQVEHCDLSDLERVKAFAERMNHSLDRLDLLLLNAGVMALPQRKETKQGLEMQIGVNHFGHFYLFLCLRDLLESSQPSRLVVLSSGAHKSAPSEGIRFDDISWSETYSGWSSYGQSKLANILFAKEAHRRFQERDAKVGTFAVHPGWVRTELTRSIRGQSLVDIAAYFVAKTVEDGARTQIDCSINPEYDDVDEWSGKYWKDVAVSGDCSQHANDMEMAKKLWTFSEGILADVGFPG